MTESDSLSARVLRLGLHGLAAHLSEIIDDKWILQLLDWEEQERAGRSVWPSSPKPTTSCSLVQTESARR